MSNTLHIYTRVSGKQQVEKFSLEAQKQEGIRKAGQLKMDYKLYCEPGFSADHDDILNRPVLTSLINECQAGKVKHIFVTEPDRLVRTVIAQQLLNKVFAAHDVTLYTISHTFDLKDTEHDFLSGLFALLSKRENTIKTTRSIRGLLEASKQGKWTGGVLLPYGYKRDENGYLAIDEDEKHVYLSIVDMCIQGIGTNTIATTLNESAIPTRGKKSLINGFHKKNRHTGEMIHVPNSEIDWADGTVYHILNNPIYKGERRYRDRILTAPAIVDPETWDKMQLSLHSRRKPRMTTHFYMLKGLLRCGICGCNMYGKHKDDKSRDNYYMCSSKRHISTNCGNRSVNIPALNNAVWLTVVANTSMFLDEVNKGNYTNSELSYKQEIIKLTQKIKAEKKRKDNLVILFENSRIDLNTFDDRSDIISRGIEVLQKKIVDLKTKNNTPSAGAHDEFKTMLNKFSLVCSDEEKRDLLIAVIKEIKVNGHYDKSHDIAVSLKFGYPIGFKLTFIEKGKKFVFTPPQLIK